VSIVNQGRALAGASQIAGEEVGKLVRQAILLRVIEQVNSVKRVSLGVEEDGEAADKVRFSMDHRICLDKTISPLETVLAFIHEGLLLMRVTRSGDWKIPSTRAPQASQAAPCSGLDILREPSQAAILLQHPRRLKILSALLEPDSATGVARRMNLPRQTVNYHVRELARVRLLVRAGRRRRRHLFEQCYVATARGYVLSPELLGNLAADPAQVADTLSAKYLLGLASKVQSELGRSAELAAAAGKRLAILSINTELRFTSPEQRAAFTQELQRAIVEVAGRHSPLFSKADGSVAEGRPFRLVVGCYPIPVAKEPESQSPILTDERSAK
jgi:DNA-binding transcriptional ArsR family regulator